MNNKMYIIIFSIFLTSICFSMNEQMFEKEASKVLAEEFLDKVHTGGKGMQLQELNLSETKKFLNNRISNATKIKESRASKNEITREHKILNPQRMWISTLGHLDDNPNARVCFHFSQKCEEFIGHLLRKKLECYIQGGELPVFEKKLCLEKVSRDAFVEKFNTWNSKKKLNALQLQASISLAQSALRELNASL